MASSNEINLAQFKVKILSNRSLSCKSLTHCLLGSFVWERFVTRMTVHLENETYFPLLAHCEVSLSKGIKSTRNVNIIVI